jgi:hypothetical protein
MTMFLWHIRKNMMEHMDIEAHQSFTLVIDIFRSHFNSDVRDLAFSMGIDLIFIPAGQTPLLQPLDATVFGELKSRGAAEWTREYITDPTQKFSKKAHRSSSKIAGIK